MITYSEQTLDSVGFAQMEKPTLFAGKLDMPLEQLDDRKFELLTYFALKQCIQNEGNWNGFERIELMGGVKDRGMDCVFRSDGAPIGVVQCKHSTKGIALGKTLVAKEILKFLLYGIAIPSLIPDINRFTYFMFGSAGLKPEAKELMDHFNEQVPEHPHLRKWVNEVIAQHASLTALQNFESVNESLIPFLQKIKVQVIPPHDFNLLLSRDFNSNLLSTFFQVRSVVDEKRFSDLLDDKLNPTLSLDKAEQLAVSASSDLSQVHGFFGTLATTHVERPETQQIHDWILSNLPTKKMPLALLEANAGMGKTIVFRDLYQKLTSKGIPVLGIKADRYYAENRMALEEKLFQQRNVNIIDVLSTLLQEHQKVVVLIDQMDALSLTLSTKRDYLTTYNRLISELLTVPGIRIILTVRSFDLNYDADLRRYKTDVYQQFPLGPLPRSEVKKVLSAYDMAIPGDTLLDLLTIPNHLNIYCKISASSLRHNDQLKSLNDLHQALWEDLMKSAAKELRPKELLYGIARTMSERERISVPNLYIDQFSKELDFLYSRGILFEHARGIQFFHQTFYDFSFAKQFVESGDSLMSYLNDKGQSLYVRPVVKMVTEYLRDYNLQAYNETLTKIVSGTKYRFHIKLLLLNSLGIQIEPTQEEKSFVTKHILPNPTYADAFLTSVHSKGWMEFLLEQQVLWDNLHPKPKLRHHLQGLLPNWVRKFCPVRERLNFSFEKEKELRANLVLQVLQNNRLESLDRVIDFLEQLQGIEEFVGLAQHVLIHIDVWENKRLLPLFDHYMPYREDLDKHHDNFWFYHILEKIVVHHLGYCITKLTHIILKLFGRKLLSFELSHELDKLLKQLYEKYPTETFFFLFELMKIIVEAHRNDASGDKPKTPLYKSLYFSDVHLVSSVSSNADEVLFDLMQDYLRKQAIKNPSWVRGFYENNRDSNAIPVLKLCAVALEANPSQFYGLAYELIHIIHAKSGLNGWDNQFQYLVRKLIGASFSFFDNSQKDSIANILFTIKRPRELSVFTDDLGKRHFVNSTGKKQYLFLTAIPQEELRKHSELWKRFQELQRKFQRVEDRPMDQSRSIAHVVGGPLSSNAYAKMDFEHWKKSMLKYGDDYIRDRSAHPTKGGKSQHAQAFKKQVEQHPGHFYMLVAELLDSDKYAQDYPVYGLWGLIEGQFDPQKVFLLYRQLLDKELDKEHFHLIIHFCQYFIQHEVMDITVMEYLANLVHTIPNPDKIHNPNDLRHETLNSMRSAALIRMMNCTYDASFGELVLQTVEQVVTDKHPLIQAAILGHVANLNHFDLNRSFALFKEASSTDDLTVLTCSFWSANFYLLNYFDELQPYLQKILEHEDLHEHGVVLIVKGWFFGHGSNGNAQKLLERAFASGEKAVCAILNTTEYLLFKGGLLHPKSKELLFRCLEAEGEDLSSRFSGLILRKFNLENFPQIYPFLHSYLKTPHAQREPRYLLNYIADCAKAYPMECLSLMEVALELGHGDIQKRGFVDREPVQAVLSIYSALKLNSSVPDKALKRTLDLFDRLLLNNRYRNHATNAIGQI